MIRYFASHPTASNLLMLIILVSGALSMATLRRETFPDFSADEVEVRVLFPGATAEEVEEVICQRVEDSIDGVRFVKEVRSEARAGIGIVVAEMAGGNIITFKDEVNTAVAAIDDFPPDVEQPVVSQMNTTDPVMLILIAGPMSTPDLKQYCENLKRQLQTLPAISLVTVQGFSDRQLRIALSSEALRRHRLSVSQVADIVTRQNIDLPAGVLETGERDIVVRFQDQRSTVQALEDLVIRGSAGGAELTLRDLGTVTEEFEFAEDKVLLNGRRAGVLSIQKTKNQDALHVADEVKAFVADARLEQPYLEFVISNDSSILVRDRLQLLTRNGWQGMLLVFGAMWLFFNLKLSFWVVMSLPVSFFGAFVLMPPCDLTINMLTMVGLLLAIGILMDDGIVIAENVAAHRARGASPLDAAVRGTREVADGVVSSFVTTVCVLGPLAGLAGDIGRVLRVVPIVLILVLTVSLIEAFIILPAHLSHALPDNSTGQSRIRQGIESMLDFVRERILGRTVDRVIEWRYAWLGAVALIFLSTVSLVAGGFIKFQAFPDLDGDVIVSRILMPPGTPLDHTERVVDQVTSGLDRLNARFKPDQPDGQDLVLHHYVTFNENADAFETGPHVATVSVDLLSAEKRSGRIDDILAAWEDAVGEVTDAVAVSYTEPTIGPSGRNIEIRLRGQDLDRLQQAGQRLHQWVGDFVGVKNLALDTRRGQPEYRVRLREGAFGLGLDANRVARQLRAAFQGVTASEIQVGTESYEIDVQLSEDDQNSYADLDYFHCHLPGGEAVPLGTIARIYEDRGWSRIARTDGVRTITLRGDTDATRTNTAQVLASVRDQFIPILKDEFPNIIVDFEGEAREAATTQESMLSGAALGLLGVFALLSFQFRSFIEPFIVMIIIPLSLIGVILGHALLGLDLSMPSMLGFVSLSGIVVNDSILLTLFLRKQRELGIDAARAAATASRQRFRAVVITSLTTIAGLLPLTLERSLQAQVLIPLAVSIAAGLMATTVLVLLVIPSLYVVLDDLGLTARLVRKSEQDPPPHIEVSTP